MIPEGRLKCQHSFHVLIQWGSCTLGTQRGVKASQTSLSLSPQRSRETGAGCARLSSEEKPAWAGARLWQHGNTHLALSQQGGADALNCPCLFWLEDLFSVAHAVVEMCWVSPGLLQCMDRDIPVTYLNHLLWFSGGLLSHITLAAS